MRMRIAATLTLVLCATTFAACADPEVASRSALVIIDVQEFYYPGGAAPLVEPEKASLNASKILASFRDAGNLVVHVRHKSSKGFEIHKHVAPIEGEKIFTKTEVSCFNGTDMLAYLKDNLVTDLVIVGMQTHMCLEAATRAAHDLGFEVTVVGDACATRDLEFDGVKVAAKDVHASTLATLSRTYAKVLTTQEYLAEETNE